VEDESDEESLFKAPPTGFLKLILLLFKTPVFLLFAISSVIGVAAYCQIFMITALYAQEHGITKTQVSA